MTEPLITPSGKIKLQIWLRERFPKGAFRTATSSRDLTEKVIEMLSYALFEEDSPVRLDIELDQNMPATRTGAAIRSLVIFDGVETFTSPLAITQSLVRLDGAPQYVSHPDAASMLLDRLIDHVEAVLARENEVVSE